MRSTVGLVVRVRMVGALTCAVALAAVAASCGATERHAEARLIALNVRDGHTRYSVPLGFPVVRGLAVGEHGGREVWVSGSGQRGSSGKDGDLCDGRHPTVHAVDVASGRLLPGAAPATPWQVGNFSPQSGASATAAGIRVEQIDGDQLNKPGEFKAVDAATGAVLWRHDGGIGQYSGIAADAHAAYVLKIGGPITAIDLKTGRTLWRSTAYSDELLRLEHFNHPWALLAGVDSGVLTVIDRTAVVGIDARTGAVRWSWNGPHDYIVQTLGDAVFVAEYGLSCSWED